MPARFVDLRGTEKSDGLSALGVVKAVHLLWLNKGTKPQSDLFTAGSLHRHGVHLRKHLSPVFGNAGGSKACKSGVSSCLALGVQ